MAFRANEAEKAGREEAFNYLVGRGIEPKQKEQSEALLFDLITQYGPVVDSYPVWHPLVTSNKTKHDPRKHSRTPSFEGLDHTIYLMNALITCPYADSGQSEAVLESATSIGDCPVATISAEVLDKPLYHSAASAVLVKCEWSKPMNPDGTIPKSVAVPLLLENELPAWRYSEVGETWETMKSDFLGLPCGSRSSLFVNQETGQYIKKLWNHLIYSGMFGPIMVDR
jgi:hypothetical protein